MGAGGTGLTKKGCAGVGWGLSFLRQKRGESKSTIIERDEEARLQLKPVGGRAERKNARCI